MAAWRECEKSISSGTHGKEEEDMANRRYNPSMPCSLPWGVKGQMFVSHAKSPRWMFAHRHTVSCLNLSCHWDGEKAERWIRNLLKTQPANFSRVNSNCCFYERKHCKVMLNFLLELYKKKNNCYLKGNITSSVDLWHCGCWSPVVVHSDRETVWVLWESALLHVWCQRINKTGSTVNTGANIMSRKSVAGRKKHNLVHLLLSFRF